MITASSIFALDLIQRPPRSPRCKLGGYVFLPRMLDKGRAEIVGKAGSYEYEASMDQHVIRFIGFDPAALKTELATGKSDGEILEWFNAHAKNKRTPWEIEQWSAYHEKRGPDSDAETLEFFTSAVGKLSKTREDIKTWMDLLDADDYVTFGGKL